MSRSGRGRFWVIDGLRVKKKEPFLCELIERNQSFDAARMEKQPQEGCLHMELDRNFFADHEDDRIDYGAIRCSVSSLRDHLFAPPSQHFSIPQFFPFVAETSQLKKGIFEDEFVPFLYECGSRGK